MKSKFRKIFIFVAVLLILAGGATAATVGYLNSKAKDVPLVYSDTAMLRELWTVYKATYIEEGTSRTIDRQQNDITTSEGQSYTMLRAVWMDDQPTFDASWQWTKDNLQRDDYLMSWKFGERADGSFGILEAEGGNNTASDGDVDLALSLLMAFSRWNKYEYLADARPIIKSIYEKEVINVNGLPVLMSNDIERLAQTEVVVNPSYFAPYAYKIFAGVDPTHNWNGLADNSYTLLNQLSEANLGSDSTSGLPPNWVLMNRNTGAFSAAENRANLDSNYGFDAIRTPWRMALDYKWNEDERAKAVLQKYSFLSEQWQSNQRLVAVYRHDGTPLADYQSAAMYGTAIGYFDVINPEQGREVYRAKLQTLYNPDTQSWANQLSYYDDNWAWFGIALSQGALPNLTVER